MRARSSLTQSVRLAKTGLARSRIWLDGGGRPDSEPPAGFCNCAQQRAQFLFSSRYNPAAGSSRNNASGSNASAKAENKGGSAGGEARASGSCLAARSKTLWTSNCILSGLRLAALALDKDRAARLCGLERLGIELIDTPSRPSARTPAKLAEIVGARAFAADDLEIFFTAVEP